ncbi:hypothetical protein C8R47DRAFT_1077597 [Mycena vitilis]|nr:hypothetical protein C8R47DRAFT_1077597 [Mycena vitilis]
MRAPVTLDAPFPSAACALGTGLGRVFVRARKMGMCPSAVCLRHRGRALRLQVAPEISSSANLRPRPLLRTLLHAPSLPSPSFASFRSGIPARASDGYLPRHHPSARASSVLDTEERGAAVERGLTVRVRCAGDVHSPMHSPSPPVAPVSSVSDAAVTSPTRPGLRSDGAQFARGWAGMGGGEEESAIWAWRRDTGMPVGGGPEHYLQRGLRGASAHAFLPLRFARGAGGGEFSAVVAQVQRGVAAYGEEEEGVKHDKQVEWNAKTCCNRRRGIWKDRGWKEQGLLAGRLPPLTLPLCTLESAYSAYPPPYPPPPPPCRLALPYDVGLPLSPPPNLNRSADDPGSAEKVYSPPTAAAPSLLLRVGMVLVNLASESERERKKERATSGRNNRVKRRKKKREWCKDERKRPRRSDHYRHAPSPNHPSAPSSSIVSAEEGKARIRQAVDKSPSTCMKHRVTARVQPRRVTNGAGSRPCPSNSRRATEDGGRRSITASPAPASKSGAPCAANPGPTALYTTDYAGHNRPAICELLQFEPDAHSRCGSILVIGGQQVNGDGKRKTGDE